MKLPIPHEVLDMLGQSSAMMEQFGEKLDEVIRLLKQIEINTRA